MLLSLITLLFLASCANTTKTSCQELDWFEIGRQDGNSALQRRPIKIVCGDSDESLSEALYNNGFDSTMSMHCAPEKAYELGYSGKPMADICPPLLLEDYTKAYNYGKQTAILNQEKIEVDGRILTIENILKDKSIDVAKRDLMNGEKIDLLEKKKLLEAQLKNIRTEESKN